MVALGFSLCACNGIGTNNPSGDSENEYNPLMFEVPEGGYDGSEVSISIGFAGYWDFLDKYIEEFNKLNIRLVHWNLQTSLKEIKENLNI